MRVKRERHRGLGQYQIDWRVDTESRILNCLWKFSKSFGMWINVRGLHRETKVETKTLRNTLERLLKDGRIREYRGTYNSRLFCITGLHDHIEHHREYRSLISDRVGTRDECLKMLSKRYKQNDDGVFVKRR